MRVLDVIVDLTCAPGRRGRRHPDCGPLPPPAGSPRREGGKLHRVGGGWKAHDLRTAGRPTTLLWARRRFSCGECGERFSGGPPRGRRWVAAPMWTARLARQLVKNKCGHVDPGGVPPLGPPLVLPHAPDPGLVRPGSRAAAAALPESSSSMTG